MCIYEYLYHIYIHKTHLVGYRMTIAESIGHMQNLVSLFYLKINCGQLPKGLTLPLRTHILTVIHTQRTRLPRDIHIQERHNYQTQVDTLASVQTVVSAFYWCRRYRGTENLTEQYRRTVSVSEFKQWGNSNPLAHVRSHL